MTIQEWSILSMLYTTLAFFPVLVIIMRIIAESLSRVSLFKYKYYDLAWAWFAASGISYLAWRF